jgi:outer membrane protein TolC
VNLTVGNWLKLGIVAPVLACLLGGGCQWALQRGPAGSRMLPVSAHDVAPPALPVDPAIMSVNLAPAPKPVPGRPLRRAYQDPGAQAAPRPMTLQECRQLTLTNNPDLQVEIWEQIARKSFADASALKVFPHAGLAAELSNRENLRYGYEEAADFALSAPLKRATWRYYGELRWSPTDALQAYYLSRNECNDTLRANYQRLRAAQKLVGTVDAAYYRLLSLQECLPLAERLSVLRASVARQAKELRQDRLADLEDYLRTEEKSSAARFRLTRIRTELERQKIILAGLMALPPQSHPRGNLAVTGQLDAPNFTGNTAELELQALKNRPEAQMEGLNSVNSINDLKRTAVKYFPKASAFYRYGKDNGYKMPDKDISEFGALLYLDLLDWLTNYREAGGVKARTVKAEQRMGAVALAISSEVRISALRCLESQEELQTINATIERATKHLRVARGKAKVGVLETVAVDDAQGNLIQEEIDQIRAVGEANARQCELSCAMGTNYTEGLGCR